MKLCKRCGGSGSLLRFEEGKRRFKKCTTCAGTGLKGPMPRKGLAEIRLGRKQQRFFRILEDAK